MSVAQVFNLCNLPKSPEDAFPIGSSPTSIYFITWRVKNGETLAPEEREIALAALRHWDSSNWLGL